MGLNQPVAPAVRRFNTVVREWTADEDPGLAVERTRLSWRRTSLTATGVLMIGVFRLLLPHPSRSTMAGVVLLVVAWFALVAAARRRISALTAGSRRTARRVPPGIGLVLTASAAAGMFLPS